MNLNSGRFGAAGGGGVGFAAFFGARLAGAFNTL